MDRRDFSNVSYDEALGRARELVPYLREQAPHNEAARSLMPEVMDTLHRSGLFRITTRISAQFLPLDNEARSTLAVYSRTRWGSRSANKQRIDAWLAALGAAEDSIEPAEVQLAANPANA